MRYQHQVGTQPCEGDGTPCPMCSEGHRIERLNVVNIAYDSYQLVDFAQRLKRDRIAWCYSFGQGNERMVGDALLRNVILQRRLAHNNEPVLTQHIRNANAKVATGEENKLRLVKRAPGSKIDSAVALSMAVSRCLYLTLRNVAPV
jgi:phage terminase large subunit-like protein